MKKVKKIPGIEHRKGKNGTTYQASIMINRKLIKRTFPRQDQALAWRTKMREERFKNKLINNEYKDHIDLNALFEMFINTKKLMRKGTEINYTSIYNKHLKDQLGRKIIRNISLEDYDKIKVIMSEKEMSNHSINRATSLLSNILNFGFERKYLREHVGLRNKNLKVDKKNIQYWSSEEIKDFLMKIEKEHYFFLIKFAFMTGLRRGELCGLKWKDIDLEAKTIRVSRQRNQDGSYSGLKGHDTKILPLFDFSYDLIKEIEKNKTDKENVFLNQKNKPINPNNISSMFSKLQDKYNVKNKIRFHGTRHSFASYLASLNVPAQTIQKLLGHKNVSTTNIYIHLSVEDLRNSIPDQESYIG